MKPFLLSLTPKYLLFVISFFLFSCTKEIREFINEKDGSPKFSGKKVYVKNITELYDAMKEPTNEGAAIVLAPGTYLLSPTYPNGDPAPNRGRLDLLKDMSLVGYPGHPGSVIIDASALPRSSVEIQTSLGTLRTGAIRVGNGVNSIEWMTLQSDGKNEEIRSMIQTDIVATPVARLRIAHSIVQGAGIGINLINRDPESNGRIVEAEIEDNVIRNNNLLSNGTGIRLQSQAANDGTIKAVLKQNYLHGNQEGIVGVNAICRNHAIHIESFNDKIENNGIGLLLHGGFTTRATNPSENNSVFFSAFSTGIRSNLGTPQSRIIWPNPGGVYAAAAILNVAATQGIVNNNRVEARFTACRLDGNAGPGPINAYGAYAPFAVSPPAGFNNTCNIYLKGISANAIVNTVQSFPAEPAGTNTVTVYR
jgi:hypothetical protein